MASFLFLKKLDTDSITEIEQINYTYQKELEYIHRIWELWNATTAERISFLDYAIQVIGNDVQYQHFAPFLYEQMASSCAIQNLFPIDRVANKRQTYENFPIDKCLVFTIPHKLRGIRAKGANIDWEEYHPNSQDTADGFYIPEFKAVFLANGQHHILRKKAKGSSSFVKKIDEYSLEDAFSNLSVSTYGEAWIFNDIQLKQERQINIIDPRIALMYDLAKERNSLQKSLNDTKS